MIPGIVASRRIDAAPPVGGAPSLVSGQIGTRSGSGTLSLPSAPTPGNLMVVLATFNLTLSLNESLMGFSRVGRYLGGGDGFVVAAFYKTVVSGDTGSVTLPGVPLAVMYEFADAYAVAAIEGGPLQQYLTGLDYEIPRFDSPYGADDLVLAAVGHIRSGTVETDPVSGVTIDYESIAIFMSSSFLRLDATAPETITGTIDDTSTSAPAFGFFAVIANNTPE